MAAAELPPVAVWAQAPLDDATVAALHTLVAEVAALGGAVGWLTVPSLDEVRVWAAGALAQDARMLLLRTSTQAGSEVLACGHWSRFTSAVLRGNAELRKVMVSPAARGTGLGRQLVSALVDDADAAGVEGLQLDCRGNNHAAIALYTSLGFVVTGRRPDWIAVGDERFDQVLLHLDLRARRLQTGRATPPVLRHGGRREGPGRS